MVFHPSVLWIANFAEKTYLVVLTGLLFCGEQKRTKETDTTCDDQQI